MIARSLARDRTYLVWYTAYSRVDLSLVSSSAPGVQKNRLKDSAACCVFFIFPSVHFKFQNSKNKSGFLPSKQQNSRTAKQTVRGRPPKHTNHPHAPRVSRSRKEKRSTAREGLDAGKSKVAGAGWGVIGWHVYSSCRAQCFAFVLAFHQHIHTYIHWDLSTKSTRQQDSRRPQAVHSKYLGRERVAGLPAVLPLVSRVFPVVRCLVQQLLYRRTNLYRVENGTAVVRRSVGRL